MYLSKGEIIWKTLQMKLKVDRLDRIITVRMTYEDYNALLSISENKQSMFQEDYPIDAKYSYRYGERK